MNCSESITVRNDWFSLLPELAWVDLKSSARRKKAEEEGRALDDDDDSTVLTSGS